MPNTEKRKTKKPKPTKRVVKVWIELFEASIFAPTIHYHKPTEMEITTAKEYGNIIVPATITYHLPNSKTT